ncbi:TetR/AcrR family transcriptional regulator [uncultured Aquimarina sp.]|uniref:TetR/AcrR family transcriptional regulator n=1 Tax=uncultured Aquimarina sp. TaxID=575652 RepID=UPI00262559B6|nr:TetR/AcrR family transcriptional regulator [uncultured Aquimarina sp.]
MGYKHNKEDILEVGYQVIRKNGYHHVGINQILKEAGIPKGSFYNFFESKEDFAIQVIQYYGEGNRSWLKGIFQESTETPINTLKSFYKLLIGYNEDDNFCSGCLINNMGNETGRLYDSLAKETKEQFDHWLDLIAEIVKKGQEAKEITNRFGAKEIANYLHSGFYGTFFKMKVERSRKDMDTWLKMTFEFIRA